MNTDNSGANYSDVVRNAMVHMSDGRLEEFRKLLSDDFVYALTGQHPFAGEIKGPDGVLAMFGQIRGAFDADGLRYEIERLIEAKNTVVSVFRGRGSMKNGKKYDNSYCAIWDFKDGKLVRITEFFDSHHAASVFA